MKERSQDTCPARSSYYGWFLLFLSILLSAYVSSLEIIPISLSNEFTLFFDIEISTTTYIMSCYYYAFVILQIPIGILLDKYRAKWIVTLSILLTSIGSILFAYSHMLLAAGIARFLMGIGSAFAFIYGAKVITDWFPQKVFALLFGIFIALESLITLAFSYLFSSLNQSMGWRKTAFVFGILGLIFACLAFLSIRNKRGYYSPLSDTKGQFRHGLRRLFNSSQIWIIGITTGVVIGALFSFLGRWATPFFRLAYQATPLTSMFFIFTVYLGYAIGSAFFCYISSSLKQRKIFIPWSILSSFLMLIVLIYPPYLPNQEVILVFFFLGFSVSAVNLGYIIISEQNIPQVRITAIAAINTFYALAIAISDSLISVFLELETAIDGSTQYNLQDFQISFFRIPIYVALALFFSFFVRKTYGKQRYE